MKIIKGHKYLYKEWVLFSYRVAEMKIIDITKTCYRIKFDDEPAWWLKEEFEEYIQGGKIEIIEDLGK